MVETVSMTLTKTHSYEFLENEHRVCLPRCSVRYQLRPSSIPACFVATVQLCVKLVIFFFTQNPQTYLQNISPLCIHPFKAFVLTRIQNAFVNNLHSFHTPFPFFLPHCSPFCPPIIDQRQNHQHASARPRASSSERKSLAMFRDFFLLST